jgi:hypothetical protein
MNLFRGTKEKAERAFYPFTRFGRVARVAVVSWSAVTQISRRFCSWSLWARASRMSAAIQVTADTPVRLGRRKTD